MNELAERRKFELIKSHLERVDSERAAILIARYLDTNPATVFVEKLEAEFPEGFVGARDLQKTQNAALVQDQELLAMLAFDEEGDEAFYEALNRRLQATAEAVPDVERVLSRALKGDDEQARLVAGALSLKVDVGELLSRADRASLLVAQVVAGSVHAGQAAAFAAATERELVQNVFSKFIVDVLMDKSGEAEMEEMAERRAIVAARTVLPLIGSPIPEVGYVDEDAQQVATRVRRAWAWVGFSG